MSYVLYPVDYKYYFEVVHENPVIPIVVILLVTILIILVIFGSWGDDN